jgi:hypothetical protein
MRADPAKRRVRARDVRMGVSQMEWLKGKGRNG